MLTVIKFLIFIELVFTYGICTETDLVQNGSRLCTMVTSYYYDYDTFFLLADIKNITYKLPIGYYVKVPISISTEYGDAHIILAESNDLLENNRCYEFALGGWGNTKSEIRRKDFVHEVYDLVKSTFSSYTLPLDSNVNVELSVTYDGVVTVLDLDTLAEFKLKDNVGIPVKYIGFSGYQGHKTRFTFNCRDEEPERFTPAITSRSFTFVSATPTSILIAVFCMVFFSVVH